MPLELIGGPSFRNANQLARLKSASAGNRGKFIRRNAASAGSAGEPEMVVPGGLEPPTTRL